MKEGVRYGSIYERLVANLHEPENEQACWYWRGKLGRGAYPRFNLYVPGLRAKVTLQVHVAMWVWLESGVRSPDDLFLAYWEFTQSGLEIDHTCVRPPCLNPDHLQPVTPKVNCHLRQVRRSALTT